MNRYESTIKEEISLRDIVFYCLKKWRCVIAMILIMAVLVGGFKYYSAKNSNQLAIQQWNETATEEKNISDSDVMQYYQSAIEENVEALQKQKDYLENSVVMQMDANHLQKGILSYALKSENTNQEENLKDALVDAYRAYVTDGRLAQLLFTQDEAITISDLRYLVTFSDASTDLNKMTVGAFQSTQEHGIFQVQVISQDADSCEKYLETAAQEIQLYSAELQDQIGSHGLTLLGSSISESQDQDIRDYQIKVLNEYKTAVRDLNILRTEARACEENANAQGILSGELTAPILVSPIRIGVKYGIVGMLLGAFISCVVLIVFFIMNDKLHSIENFEARFGMCLLGRVIEPVKGKGIFGILDRWIQQLGEGAFAALPYDERIKIVASNVKTAISKKEGNTCIMLAGTIASRDAKEVCAAIANTIGGVTFSDYRQMIFDASALEELVNYDGVLFIEKKDVSSLNLLCQESKMAKDRGANTLGVVVI